MNTMTPEHLLRQLFNRHDEGDQAGIIRLLARHRGIIRDATPSREGGSPPVDRSAVVSVLAFDRQLIVRPIGPSVGEREAMIIRTEVNRVLLERLEPLEQVIVDLEAVATVSASVLRLVNDLRRSAGVLGATTRVIGIPEEVARPIRRMQRDRPRQRRGLANVMRSILP